MSLEDTAKLEPDRFDVGDKLCKLPPGKLNMVVEGYYEMNRGNQNMFYYVQVYPANPLHGEKERIVVNWIPKSRESDLKPGD